MKICFWSNNKQKKILVSAILLCFFMVIILYPQYDKKTKNYVPSASSSSDDVLNGSHYLVDSLKCKILNLNPFDAEVLKYHKPEKYLPCRKYPYLLTYITKKENVATLSINETVFPLYSKNKLYCDYAYICRGSDLKKPDDVFKLSHFTSFDSSVELAEDFVTVQCHSAEEGLVYENTHATVTMKGKIKENNSVENRLISVLIIGIDSVSRLNFIRNMPRTHKFLQNWISLKGYNKIGDNTFPNVMAVLTGYNEIKIYSECDPQEPGGLDRCPYIWKDFKKLGYVTAYAEDESWLGTFNLEKRGFREPPTDYYFRPYILNIEKLESRVIEDNKYCTGPETTGERLLNIIKDFTTTFRNSPSFGIFWMNSFSHNSLNQVSTMDGPIKNFFETLTDEGILDNTMIIFLSDHGVRCGEFRNTAMGWLEERLPFIYIWIPKLFRQEFPHKYSNLQRNINKLTSPFDLFLTLQEIIDVNKTSEGCPNCQSLFSEIPLERSCRDAGIAQHWCTCANFNRVSAENSVIKEAALHFIKEINSIISKTNDSEKCAEYSLGKIHKVGVSQSYVNEVFFLLTLETKPKAFFETTLSFHHPKNGVHFETMGGISRTDKYAPHSKCVEDAILKKYCYCVN